MEGISKFIDVILKVAAFSIIVIGIIFALTKIYPNLKLYFQKDEIMEKAKPNLDLMLDKFDLCDNVDDYNCFCEVFTNFPASLPKEIGLQFKDIQDGTNLTAFFSSEKDVLDWRKLKSEYGSFSLISNQFSKDRNFKIVFDIKDSEGYPAMSPWGMLSYGYIVSPNIIKNKATSYFIITSYIKNKEKIEAEISQKIQEMPKCTNGRIKAISFFESLTEKLKKNIAVSGVDIDIGEGFYIEVKDKNGNGKVKGEIKLVYNEKIVKKINETLDWISFNKEIGKWRIKNMNETISKDLVCDGDYLRLEKRDKINIEIVDGKACIKKL